MLSLQVQTQPWVICQSVRLGLRHNTILCGRQALLKATLFPQQLRSCIEAYDNANDAYNAWYL